MKEITIAISDAAYRALVSHCHRDNANNKTDLTFDEWYMHHLEGMAIDEDLALAIGARRTDLEAAQLAVTKAFMDECRAPLLERIRKDDSPPA